MRGVAVGKERYCQGNSEKNRSGYGALLMDGIMAREDLEASRIAEVRLIFTDFSWFHGVALLPHTFRRSSFGSGGRRLLYRTPGCNLLAVRDYLDVQKVRETNRQSKEKVRMRAEVFLNFLIFPDTSRWP